MNAEDLYDTTKKWIIEDYNSDRLNTIPYGLNISIDEKRKYNVEISKKFQSDLESLNNCYKNKTDIEFLNHAVKHFNTHVSMFAKKLLKL